MRRAGRRPELPADFYERAAQQAGPAALPGGFSLQGAKRPPLKAAAVIFIVIVAVALLRRGAAGYPALQTSCSRAAFALSAASARRGTGIAYSLTGPAGPSYVLAIDAAVGRLDARGRLSLGPAPGVSAARVEQASPVTALPGCRFRGRFGVLVPPGRHTVELLEVGATASRVLASGPLTVTG